MKCNWNQLGSSNIPITSLVYHIWVVTMLKVYIGFEVCSTLLLTAATMRSQTAEVHFVVWNLKPLDLHVLSLPFDSSPQCLWDQVAVWSALGGQIISWWLSVRFADLCPTWSRKGKVWRWGSSTWMWVISNLLGSSFLWWFRADGSGFCQLGFPSSYDPYQPQRRDKPKLFTGHSELHGSLPHKLTETIQHCGTYV